MMRLKPNTLTNHMLRPNGLEGGAFDQLSAPARFLKKHGHAFKAAFKTKVISPRKPATLAVWIQVAALLSVAMCSVSIRELLLYSASVSPAIANLISQTLLSPTLTDGVSANAVLIYLIVMQAIIAMQLSRWCEQAQWWRYIHAAFPLAIGLMSQLHVPNGVYLAGFVVTLSLYWTAFRTQVPFYPSRPAVWQDVAKWIPESKPIRMIDIGSGLGDLVMHIAKHRPKSQLLGIEIAPMPWAISAIRAKWRRSSAQFKLGDYRELDFSQYDVIFAYLSPAAMLALWEKANREMQTGSLLMSYEFEIPGTTPSYTIRNTPSSPVLYVWAIQ